MPSTATPPADDVVSPATVGAVAFDALLRDGHARRVWGDLALATGAAATPAHRAAALSALVPERATVGRDAAAWVHTGADLPARVQVLVGPRRRRPDPHPLRITHECVLAEGDTVELAGLRVTTVQRTGLDIARWHGADSARNMLLTLCRVGFDPTAALHALAAISGHAGVREARTTLTALLAPAQAAVRRG